ncbi:DegT/DnrJ/EryC1/StrS family aminotransferase [Pedobacter cryoconitis]|uniref:dTDP-4-amino-4,6-dideoxygalactose transaminase n=1 Tax=Pedobacter cryoconitis TaxID=188932 RepID=A0A327SX20_9SPHI|nr:DegT/DnrJ/EryC1/StrS family aminotransferase [Pedobacter cryoconitis]RAJ33469.1 dTDP-4-amino-4,6-dideoxygalactose transaminase [Pedobacter cryoconitis]
MAKLAINGGDITRTTLFPAYNTIGQEEKDAVMKVLETGNLSQFLGAYHNDFLGGPNVREFESKWAKALGVKHAVSVNSNTSGLFTAMGAIGIQPGDEVIVSPYSMSASAIAPLLYGGIPVFADIDPVTFCMAPESIESRITSRTKAILVVHIFGHPANMDLIMAIAKKHNLIVIEDCAQAPMAKYKGKYVGTIGDLGIFSLNYHKHIHTGEGGVITSNNDDLIDRCQMIRNHAENVVGPKGIEDLTNMIGFNFRMTEIECAIGIQQLAKLPDLLAERLENVAFLNEHLSKFSALELQPHPEKGSVHTYYVHPIKFNKEIAGIDRDTFVNALKAELPSAILRETAPLIGMGYVKPLYLQPIYQQRAGWAFNHPAADQKSINYTPGLCPIAEKMHFEVLFTHEFMRPGMSTEDLLDVVSAFQKIFDNIDELKSVETRA